MTKLSLLAKITKILHLNLLITYNLPMNINTCSKFNAQTGIHYDNSKYTYS